MLGKHHSKITKLKMSKIHKGNIHGFQKGNKINLGRNWTKETREKLRKANLGRKHTEETKRKIGKAQIGHKLSEEAKRKIGLVNRGVNNARWIKDRSIVLRNKRNDPIYQQWVKKIKKRDKNTCIVKHKSCSGYNIVHHIKGWAQYPKLRYEVNNGITLCQAHHPLTRAEEKRLEPLFQALVSVSSELI